MCVHTCLQIYNKYKYNAHCQENAKSPQQSHSGEPMNEITHRILVFYS
jgi:hypothetical protein